MISLVTLLKEATETPKAIILAGAPGAGKGYILKDLDLGLQSGKELGVPMPVTAATRQAVQQHSGRIERMSKMLSKTDMGGLTNKVDESQSSSPVKRASALYNY